MAAKRFERAIASIHFDRQYLHHGWPGVAVVLDHPVSFTLAIALPRHGGGLNTRDIAHAHAQRPGRADQTPAELSCGHAPVFHAYQPGRLALHSGHLMHQLAPGIDLQPDDERITVQGHGVRVVGIWQLCW